MVSGKSVYCEISKSTSSVVITGVFGNSHRGCAFKALSRSVICDRADARRKAGALLRTLEPERRRIRNKYQRDLPGGFH